MRFASGIVKYVIIVVILFIVLPLAFLVFFGLHNNQIIGTEVESGIYGTAIISPTCAGAQKVNQICSKPYVGKIIITPKNNTEPASSYTTSLLGNFRILLDPGENTLGLDQKLYRFFRSREFIVQEGKYLQINLEIDTGIR